MRRFQQAMILIATVGACAIGGAAGAEPYPGWYGAVDLGYNSAIDRVVVVSPAECRRLGGKVSKRADGRSHCDAKAAGIVANIPGGRPRQEIAGVAWALSDNFSMDYFRAKGTNAGGKVATSSQFQYCVLKAKTAPSER